MVDRVTVNALLAHEATNGTQTKKVLHMVKNERMGGYIPSWEVEPISAKDQVEKTLEQAQNSKSNSMPSFEAALAYQHTQHNTGTIQQKNDGSFGFNDLFDMVNPLHHIPLVGHAYRSITGDEIKPIGQIIGGAVFGGPVGAGAAMANVVIKEETGQDMGEMAFALAFQGERPSFKSPTSRDNPIEVLEYAAQADGNVNTDLPASLLAFTPSTVPNSFHIERVNTASGRTAGQMTKQIKQGLDEIANARQAQIQHKLETISYEPMTVLKLNTVSDLY